MTASNGQLKLDYAKGLLTINAPKAQGISGNLAAAGSTTLLNVTIKSDLALGHIVVVPLDGQPLATSARMLLQVMSEEKASGFADHPGGERAAHHEHRPRPVAGQESQRECAVHAAGRGVAEGHAAGLQRLPRQARLGRRGNSTRTRDDLLFDRKVGGSVAQSTSRRRSRDPSPVAIS